MHLFDGVRSKNNCKQPQQQQAQQQPHQKQSGQHYAPFEVIIRNEEKQQYLIKNLNTNVNPNVNPNVSPNVDPNANPNVNTKLNPNVNPEFNPNVKPNVNPNPRSCNIVDEPNSFGEQRSCFTDFNTNVNQNIHPNVDLSFSINPRKKGCNKCHSIKDVSMFDVCKHACKVSQSQDAKCTHCIRCISASVLRSHQKFHPKKPYDVFTHCKPSSECCFCCNLFISN